MDDNQRDEESEEEVLTKVWKRSFSGVLYIHGKIAKDLLDVRRMWNAVEEVCWS